MGYDVVGARTPGAMLTLRIHRRDGSSLEVPVRCRLDTAEEVGIYEAGGVLQRSAQDSWRPAGRSESRRWLCQRSSRSRR
jgi:aconitate hydratase